MTTATSSTASAGLIANQMNVLTAIQANTSGTITQAFADMIGAVMPSAAAFRSAYATELSARQDALESQGDDPSDAKVSLYWLTSSGYLSTLLDAINANIKIANKAAEDAMVLGAANAKLAGMIGATAMAAQAAGVPVSQVQQPEDDGTDETVDMPPDDTGDDIKTGIMAGVMAGLGSQAIMQGVQMGLQGALQSMLGLGDSTAAAAMQQGASLLISANSGILDGWIWTANGGACIACLEMDGSFHTWDEDLDSHDHCACMQVPYSGPQSGLDDYAGHGEDWFNAQSDAVQAEILGPSKYLAWKNGDVQLMDLVSTDGGYLHERSLKDLGLDFRDYLQQMPTKRELLELPDISLLGPHDYTATLTEEESALLEEAQRAYAAEVPKLPEIKVPGNTMGYKITDTDGGIAKLNAALGHELTDDEIGSLVGAQKGDFVEVDGQPLLGNNTIASFTLHSSDWNGIEDITDEDYQESNVWAGRTLKYDSDGKLVMDNDGFYVQKTGEGTGIRYFADEVNGLSSQGVDRIETNAMGAFGDPQYNGYYSWARYGYQANLSDYWETFRDYYPGVRIPKGLKGLDLQELMLEPKGPAFWKKYGEQFAGEFDLAEGSTSHQALDAYLEAKGIEIEPLATRAEEATTAAEVSPEVKALQDQHATLATQRDAVQSKLDTLSEKWRAAVLDQAKYDPEDDAEEWQAAEKKITSIEKQQATQMKKLDSLNGKMAKVDAKIEKAMPVAQAAEPPELPGMPPQEEPPTPSVELPSVANYPLPEIDQEAEDKLIQQIQDALPDTGVASHTDALSVGQPIQDYINSRMGQLGTWQQEASDLRAMTAANDYSKLTGDQLAWMKGDTSLHGGLTIEEVENQYATAFNAEIQRLLPQVRDVGGVDLAVADGGNAVVTSAIHDAEDIFPADWLAASSDQGELVAATGNLSDVGKGYYSALPRGNGRIAIKLDDNPTPLQIQGRIAHELTHRMEDAVPGLSQLEHDFYEMRTADEEFVALTNGVKGLTKLDQFAYQYFGRQPIPVSFPGPGGALHRYESYELLSHGIQYVLTADPVGMYFLSQDPEFLRFILGVLFGAKGKVVPTE